MNALERLRAVLCAPDGEVCIRGSDGDRAIIQDALAELDSLTRPADGNFVMVPRAAIDWLNGEGPEGFECPLDRYFRGEPPSYWWRSVFREKAGLSAAPQQHGQEVDEAERGLQTPRRVKAVELLLSLGYQWDGAQWSQPQQPAEAVAVDLERFREPVLFWHNHCYSALGPDSALRVRPEALRLLAIIDSAPPAIDTGKLRELAKWMRARADGGWTGKHQPVSASTLRIWAGTIDAALIGGGGEKGNG